MQQKDQKDITLSSRIDQLLELHAHEVSPWRIFKIMSEFVQGFEFLSKFKRTVSFFGTARNRLNDEMCQEAQTLARKLSQEGFTVVTGGGPGIMEAANKGAYDAGGESVGINIQLPEEQRINQYVKKSESFSYFFTRKVMLSFASEVYIFFPGGFGTLDEFFEIITLVQTRKIERVPVILVGRAYWEPLLGWIRETVYEERRAIDKEDMEIYRLVDTADEAFEMIKKLINHQDKKS